MWEEIYTTYYGELFRFACGLCQSQAQAEDLVQEVFIRALQNGDTFEDLGKSQRRAWLYRALKNLIIDWARRAVLEQQYAQLYPKETATVETGFTAAETMELLLKLPEPDRSLFRMRYLEGYSAEELAVLFRLPPGTIRSKLSRSRSRLKKLLNEP